jgi:hypothetical protein
MMRHECEREVEAVVAARQGRFGEELRAHVMGCEVCSTAVAVSQAFEDAREETLAGVELPEAGRVWRQAQLRARQEAVRSAGRPITAAQVVAFGAAMVLLGACFGATSQWFQAGLRRLGSVDKAAWLVWATGVMAEHGALILGTLAVVVLLPTAVFVALGRE